MNFIQLRGDTQPLRWINRPPEENRLEENGFRLLSVSNRSLDSYKNCFRVELVILNSTMKLIRVYVVLGGKKSQILGVN